MIERFLPLALDFVCRAELVDHDAFAANAFGILRGIARLVNYPSTHNEGRELVIRALPAAQRLSNADREILVSLVRSVGLFPYMTEHLQIADLDDYIAYELHRADALGSGVIFHSLQAHIFHQLMAGANVVLSASTSVGKSLVIDAVIDLPWTRRRMPDAPDDFFAQPAAIADTVWHLAHQEKSAWSFEVDLRPFGERW